MLKSANPLDPPAIDLGLLCDPEDKEVAALAAAARLAKKIV